MTKKSARAKAPALPVPQTLEEADTLLAEYGALSRKIEDAANRHEAAVQELNAEHVARLRPDAERMGQVFGAIQAFAEAHRPELTRGGRKTVKLVHGELAWRTRPPKVQIKGEKTLVDWLRSADAPRRLKRFLRTTWKIDREAILKDERAALEMEGVQIVRGLEDFIVAPADAEIAERLS